MPYSVVFGRIDTDIQMSKICSQLAFPGRECSELIGFQMGQKSTDPNILLKYSY